MAGQFLAGTCGYSYSEWREVFYPKDLRAPDYLKYYSLVFPFVELDFSWYKMPKPETLAAMADQTQPGFLFALKAHKSLTHEIGEDWEFQAGMFADAAESLLVRGKLAAVLVQLPYSFAYTAENRSYLASLLSSLSSFPLVVEFRNEAWYQDRVFAELERRDIALALLDRPELPGLPPETDRLTNSLAYLRFHGKNAATWWGGDAVSRYDYDYSTEELKSSARRIIGLSRSASRVIAAFNNHAKANAPKNARSLVALVKALSPDPA
ncbi:MAG TPA: DUF72 domain-containing protein [Rectinemataceae bacterium]